MRHSTDELRALDGLLDEALELPAAARDAWLAGLAPEHAALAPTLRKLLAEDASVETGDLLARLPEVAPIFDALAAAERDGSLGPGDTVGPYRLLRELGVGGMGVVWLAERTDGLIKRPVALKLPLLPVQHRALAERFARERDILASLAHPGIARLYDAGVAANGQPYLALEYVEGRPLTDYCDARKLDLRARIALLIQVLRAVEHAHANLVVHRDLKPSNILVTAAGDVRLLDFGIAKMIDQGESGETELTRMAGRALTPGYAAPEQISGGAISTASDVYSVGVIAYEVLVGARPYRPRGDDRPALEDAVLHVDPVRPSLAVPAGAAANRGLASERKLASLLEGDLDTVLAKALKKLPQERYATAAAFAEDLERHLRGDAIAARADSTWYVLRKLVRRHRVAAAATAAVTAALIAGVSIALWQAAEARREAARASAVQQFVVDLFRVNTADQPDPLRARQATARELLDRGVERVDRAFAAEPEAQIALLDTLAELYIELGLWTQASALIERQLALARSIWGDRDPRLAPMLREHARALDMLTGVPAERIVAALAEAERIFEANGDRDSLDRARLHGVAGAFYREHDVGEARRHAELEVAIRRRANPDDPRLASALSELATVRLRQGERAAALAANADAVATARRLGLPDFQLVYLLYRAGEANAFTGNVETADALLREALEASERVNGAPHPATMAIERALARHLAATSRRDEALALIAGALERAKPAPGEREPYQIQDMRRQFFDAYWNLGDLAGARAMVEGAFAAMGSDPSPSFEHADLLSSRAVLEIASGNLARASAALERSRAMAERIGIPSSGLMWLELLRFEAWLRLAGGDAVAARSTLETELRNLDASGLDEKGRRLAVQQALADALLAAGDPDAARRLAQDTAAALQRSPLRNYMLPLDAELELTLGRIASGSDCATALPHFERAAALYRNAHVPTSPWRASAEALLASCLARLGRGDEARAALERARTAHKAHVQLSDQFRAPLREAESVVARARAGAPRAASAAR